MVLTGCLQHALRMPGGGHHNVAPGQITGTKQDTHHQLKRIIDDGELTISLGRGLLNCTNGVFNVENIAIEYPLFVCGGSNGSYECCINVVVLVVVL